MKRVLAAALLCLSLGAAPALSQIETVATFDASIPPGNLGIGPDGRIFMSVHRFFGQQLRLVEVLPGGKTRPYPNAAWAAAPKGDGPGLLDVLGLNVDRRGILWILDGQGEAHTGRIIGWNTKTESLERIYYLGAPVTRKTSFLNDLAIDRTNNTIYISDTGDGKNSALIVLDMTTGQARRVLEGSKFTRPEDIDMIIDNRLIKLGGQPARIGVNPITIDPTNTWVYFAPMSARAMYRVRSADLRDTTLSDAQLEARVERYGDKPISDGSAIDMAGNVYITSITDAAIGVTKPDGSYEVLYQDETLPWPDGFAVGADGNIYATINELHRSPVLNEGKNTATGAFKIVRFPALAPAISGR